MSNFSDPKSSTPTIASSTPGTVCAGEALTIYTVESVGSACARALEGSAEVTVDLGQVTTCDSLGVQVLLAARRAAEVRRVRLSFVNVPPAVFDAATAIACESVFQPVPADL